VQRTVGHPVLQYVRRLAAADSCRLLSDGALLQRFVRQHDEHAFAAILRRHGPLVFGVCRRLLHNDHDAEDVFQATFLALARKAACVRNRQSLSCWLHGAARRLALKAKDQMRRQRERELGRALNDRARIRSW
jgi:DNA-directed RNA polymerase specialized sigma24 family protein